MKIVVVRNVLGGNQRRAAALRRSFKRAGTLAVNLISAPGSGKTSLIERLAPELRKRKLSVAVVEGDVATTYDAERVEAAGAPAVQVTTSGVCHLDAAMVASACRKLRRLPEVLFIENVGNLVCPAAFDLGEAERVVLVSVPEGDDKPAKYPEAFAGATALVVSKTDLRTVCRFNIPRAVAAARAVNPSLAVFEVSSRTGFGVGEFADWLVERRGARVAAGRRRKTTKGRTRSARR
jgi:hydrogenase nickel incorporation protein HypB